MSEQDRGKGAGVRALSNVILENREKLLISGVLDVEEFDETELVLQTVHGILTVTGSAMKIENLNVETKDLSLVGHINSLVFSEDGRAKGSFWTRVLR